MATETVEIAEEELVAEQDIIPEWDAELHVLNDDSFPADAVIAALCEVIPGCGFAKAMKLMIHIHRSGSGTVWQGAREICELYCQQLSARGLDARVV